MCNCKFPRKVRLAVSHVYSGVMAKTGIVMAEPLSDEENLVEIICQNCESNIPIGDVVLWDWGNEKNA